MRTSRLSLKQHAVLAAVGRRTVDGPTIQAATGAPGTEGVHQTAASLVRRGLLVKSKHRGIVYYTRAPRPAKR